MIDVRDIMTPIQDLHTLPPNATVAEAGTLMAELHIRHVPILDDAGCLLGIVSHRDVLAATGPKTGHPAHKTGQRVLGDIMSTPVMTVDPRVSVRRAGLCLRALRIGCLAVMRDGRLEGLVTDSDFLSVAINLLEQIEEIEPSEEF
jgi:CBS domain-containing membrane protein